MAVYVISDIHGEYDMFMEMLKKLGLKETDTLYVLGDMIDRGPHPIRVVQKLMEMSNAVCLLGNHELMALKCLDFLMKEITEETIGELDEEKSDYLFTWMQNGCNSTIKEYRALGREEREEVIDFLKELLLYEELSVGDNEYLLVHAGLGNFRPDKDIEDYTVDELVWKRADYDMQYFPDSYVITGHTPTQMIKGNPRPGFIFRQNNHIAIDCGAFIPEGRLAAICLDNGEEYYVEAERESF